MGVLALTSCSLSALSAMNLGVPTVEQSGFRFKIDYGSRSAMLWDWTGLNRMNPLLIESEIGEFVLLWETRVYTDKLST